MDFLKYFGNRTVPQNIFTKHFTQGKIFSNASNWYWRSFGSVLIKSSLAKVVAIFITVVIDTHVSNLKSILLEKLLNIYLNKYSKILAARNRT